jgi:hypothetical protein
MAGDNRVGCIILEFPKNYMELKGYMSQELAFYRAKPIPGIIAKTIKGK